VRQMIIASLYL